MKRRTFLKTVGGAAGVCALNTPALLSATPAAEPPPTQDTPLPRRVLGRTGEEISVVGFPGLALANYDQARGTDGLHKAFDQGVNYFDVAPAYGNWSCITKMGIGMTGIDRGKYFLACKTKQREKDGAREELEKALTLLKTDHFDLFQLHHLVQPADVKKALGPGGAMEAILKAKDEGKVKHIGFSAHTTKAALEAIKGFRFDTVMFPINFVEYYLRDFGREVMAQANAQGAALLSIKPMSRGAWHKDETQTRKWWYRAVEDEKELNLAWRWVLSQKGVVAGIPPSFLDLLDKAIATAKAYRRPTETEVTQLQDLAKTCESLFLREENQVAFNLPLERSPYPDCPHECMRHAHTV